MLDIDKQIDDAIKDLSNGNCFICNKKTVRQLYTSKYWQDCYSTPEDIFKNVYVVGYIQGKPVIICEQLEDGQLLYYANSIPKTYLEHSLQTFFEDMRKKIWNKNFLKLLKFHQ